MIAFWGHPSLVDMFRIVGRSILFQTRSIHRHESVYVHSNTKRAGSGTDGLLVWEELHTLFGIERTNSTTALPGACVGPKRPASAMTSRTASSGTSWSERVASTVRAATTVPPPFPIHWLELDPLESTNKSLRDGIARLLVASGWPSMLQALLALSKWGQIHRVASRTGQQLALGTALKICCSNADKTLLRNLPMSFYIPERPRLAIAAPASIGNATQPRPWQIRACTGEPPWFACSNFGRRRCTCQSARQRSRLPLPRPHLQHLRLRLARETTLAVAFARSFARSTDWLECTCPCLLYWRVALLMLRCDI